MLQTASTKNIAEKFEGPRFLWLELTDKCNLSWHSTAKPLSKNQARLIAANIAKLPKLLRKPKGQAMRYARLATAL